MNLQNSELFEKIRQQFNSSPYPKTAIEVSPKQDANSLYIHNLLTPFYLRNQQLIDPTKTSILDVGCGSGYKTLMLAEANPGATIVGIDLSEKSVELAQARLRFHGFTEVQFHALPLEEVAQLGIMFDYINCDEMLYLMPDLVTALQMLKTVLKPQGILRSNLHSLYQRQNYFRAQQMFTLMGLMKDNPEETEIGVVLDTMKALADYVPLKQQTWTPDRAEEHPQEYVLMNYLFQGDKGYTIPDLFAALQSADLEFISMVNYRHWDLIALFQDPKNLPFFWEMGLPHLSIAEQLQLFELLAPIHRLLDFWCGHPGQTATWQLPQTWEPDVWQTMQIRLHPQLQTTPVKDKLIQAIQQQQPFEISQSLSAAAAAQAQVTLGPVLSACLLPLWDAPQQFPELVQRALVVRAHNPVTLEPADPKQISQDLRDALINLESYLYVLFNRLE